MSVHGIGLGRSTHALAGRRKSQIAWLERFGLRSGSHLLEIGCGIGWLAYDLAQILDGKGSYAGFDVRPDPITWLTENLAPRLPNFRFDLVDARNPRYRPKASRGAEEIVFPYDDRQFDLICAFGVFMHVAREGIENYLREIARVLEPGAPALLSFMAVTTNDKKPRNGHRPYISIGPGIYTSRPDRVGWSLAYDDDLVREMIGHAGLALTSFEEGAWHGRRNSEVDGAPGADLYVVTTSTA
jgi:cyclopropane fatty-acyl-phospholipid synthase-like methyltransferase